MFGIDTIRISYINPFADIFYLIILTTLIKDCLNLIVNILCCIAELLIEHFVWS